MAAERLAQAANKTKKTSPAVATPFAAYTIGFGFLACSAGPIAACLSCCVLCNCGQMKPEAAIEKPGAGGGAAVMGVPVQQVQVTESNPQVSA